MKNEGKVEREKGRMRRRVELVVLDDLILDALSSRGEREASVA